MSPVRTCVGCRERGPSNELLRCVADGKIVRFGRNDPGRGAWIHPKESCLALADRRQAWARALKVAGPLDTSALLDALLVQIDHERAV
jgi:predicted RNA-binding protein YlxR (DUF448 family)